MAAVVVVIHQVVQAADPVAADPVAADPVIQCQSRLAHCCSWLLAFLARLWGYADGASAAGNLQSDLVTLRAKLATITAWLSPRRCNADARHGRYVLAGFLVLAGIGLVVAGLVGA